MTIGLRRLGQSDIQLSPIGLGCWQFSQGNGIGGKFWQTLPEDQIAAIVAASLAGGINWFDTAEIYGWGKSETALVHSLRAAGRRPGEGVIATKWYPVFRTAASIVATFPQRQAALEGWPIDLHQVHMPWGCSTRQGEMKAMARLLSEKQVRAVGVSNFSASQLRQAHRALQREGFTLVSNQVRYNLAQRYPDFDDTIQTAKELGISIIAFSPLAQGLLTGKFHEHPELVRFRVGLRKFMPLFSRRGLARTWPLIQELTRLGQAYQASPAQVALNWLLSYHGDMVVAIPGATTTAHAAQNVGSMAFQLTAAECRQLADLGR